MASHAFTVLNQSTGQLATSRRWLCMGALASAAALLAACGSSPKPISTTSERTYRTTAAQHLYARNAQRIYPGKLPPMLYAIGVVQVDLDHSGHVQRLHWLRAPQHAPEVTREIERTIRAAAPFPAGPQGRASRYTETWLWDRSGRFQLDTLSEGQLGQ